MAYLFSALALLVSTVSFLYLRAYVKKQTSVERIPAQTREAVGQIIAQIDRITDRDSLLVEERVHKVNEMLAALDKRILTLDKEVSARAALTLNAAPAIAYDARGRKPERQSSLHGDTLTPPGAKAEAPRAQPSADRPQPPPPVRGKEAEEQENTGSEYEEFTAAQLADMGVPPARIAQRLGKSLGELEFEGLLPRYNQKR